MVPMRPEDYLAQLICLACVLWSLARLMRRGVHEEVPAFWFFLLMLIPSSMIWLGSWFSVWPVYYLDFCAAALAAGAIESAWRVTYNLYWQERRHARWIAALGGIFLGSLVLYHRPTFPKFPELAYLSGSVLGAFALGCSSTAVIYWRRFPSYSVRPYVGQAACLGLYGLVLVESGSMSDPGEWHPVMDFSCIARGALLVAATLSLAGSQIRPSNRVISRVICFVNSFCYVGCARFEPV